MTRQIAYVLLHKIHPLLVYCIQFIFCLLRLLRNELFGGAAGINSALCLFVNIFGCEFGGHCLSRSGITTPICDIEAVRNIVAAGVHLHLDVTAHVIDDRFCRLSTHSFHSKEIVFLNERFKRTAAGNHLRNAGQLASKTLIGHAGNDRFGQS